MKNKAFIILILTVICISSFTTEAKDDKKYVRQGNKQYENKKYNDAEIKYRKALAENPANHRAEFNLGDALYKQGNYKEAGEKFELMNNKKLDKSAKNDIQYNLGNSYFEQAREKAKSGDTQGSMDFLNKAIDSYKGAMKLDGKDGNARYNHELARRMLIQQQQQQQKNKDNKDQNKDNKDKKDKKEQNKNDKNKDDKNKDKNKDKSENQSDKKEQNKQPEKQPQPQKSKISDKDAERILNALQSKEKEKMNKMKKMKSNKSNIEKKW